MKLILALLLASSIVHAQPLTFADVCAGATVAIVPPDVEVWCPGKEVAWLRIIDCKQAVVEVVRPRVLSVELIPVEEDNIHGWVHFYQSNPTAWQTRIVLESQTLARRDEITHQFEGGENLRVMCTFN